MELPGNAYRITKANHWINEATRKELRAKPHPANSTIFAKIGVALTYNRRRLLSQPTIVDNNMMAAVPKESEVTALFLYYLLKVTDFNKVVSGTALPYLNAGDLANMKVEVPPLAQQEYIAGILGALDEKIELSRKTNETMEQMAKALFKSWFVDFEPSHFKASGRRPTGINPEIIELFPRDFEKSTAGSIPKGWTVKKIEDVCTTVTRGVTPEYEVGSGKYIINQKVNRGPELDLSSLKELSKKLDVPSDRYAKRWDVLVNCLGEGTLGRTHLFKGDSDVYAVDQHMSICRAKLECGGAYIYQILSSPEGQSKIESLKTGSTGMTMFNISKLRCFEMIWPTTDILEAYFTAVKPLWNRITSNEKEIIILQEIRDNLLSSLLSGTSPTSIRR